MSNERFIDAALKAPFYKQFLRKSHLQDWSQIPFTTKEHLRQANAFDLLGTSRENVATYHETSGTTGTPTPSWYSHRDIQTEADVVIHSSLQLKETDIVLNRFPFAMAIPSFIVYWACQKVGAAHIGADKASFVTPDKRVVDIIKRTELTILAMLPSEAEKIYKASSQMGVSLKGVRALLLAGELVSPKRKAYLEKLWGVPIYLLFGTTETGGLFMTCEYGHYHLNHPNVYIEVVDAQGELVTDGKRGHCVISTAREGTPLLRYFNHDLIAIKEGGNCLCGDKTPVLIHYGRDEDCVRSWTFYDIQEAVYALSSVPFMWKVNVLEDRVIFIFQYTEESPDLAHIEAELAYLLGVDVEVEYADIIPLHELVNVPKYSKYTHIEHVKRSTV